MNDDQNKEIKTVCGGLLKDPAIFPSVEYQGEVLFFCAQACLHAFLQNPEGFLSGEIEHPNEND